MSTPPLNLATRPFRNERLPALLLALGFTVAGAISIKQGLAIRALLPGRTSALARQVGELENERERLRTEASHFRAPRPEPAALAQWTLLKDLVDRRTFSWSGLFSVLEETLPKGVRLVSITPSIKKGERLVELSAVARTNEDVLELIRVLEDRPEFDDVLPMSRGTREESQLEFRLAMKYMPQPLPPVVAAANPAVAPSPGLSPTGVGLGGESPSPAAVAVAPAPSPAATASAAPVPSPQAAAASPEPSPEATAAPPLGLSEPLRLSGGPPGRGRSASPSPRRPSPPSGEKLE